MRWKGVSEMAFESTIIVRGCESLRVIRVEADEEFLQSAGGERNGALMREYFQELVGRIFEIHRLQGLSLEGVSRISFSTEQPAEGNVLFSRNHELWRKLAVKAEEEDGDGWYCMEDERCKCSWCVPIDPIVITG
jgi:hypothetical protein